MHGSQLSHLHVYYSFYVGTGIFHMNKNTAKRLQISNQRFVSTHRRWRPNKYARTEDHLNATTDHLAAATHGQNLLGFCTSGYWLWHLKGMDGCCLQEQPNPVGANLSHLRKENKAILQQHSHIMMLRQEIARSGICETDVCWRQESQNVAGVHVKQLSIQIKK